MKIETLQSHDVTFYLNEERDHSGYSLFSVHHNVGQVNINAAMMPIDDARDWAKALTDSVAFEHRYQNGEIVRLHDCVTQTGLNYGGIVVGFTESFVKVLWVKWSIVNELPFQSNEIASTLIKLPRKN